MMAETAEELGKRPEIRKELERAPRVIFRVSENTWLEAIVRYLVAPREARSRQNSVDQKASHRA